MKLSLKLILAVLVLALLLPFTILKNDRGQPMMSFPDLGLPDFDVPELPSMPAAEKLAPRVTMSQGVDKVYKWRDTDGSLQFTSEPPPPGLEYVVKEIDPNVNVIPAVSMPTEENTVETTAEASPPAPASMEEEQGLDNPYDPDTINKLFEDANNLKQKLEQRFTN